MEFFITNLYIVFSRVQAYLKDVCQLFSSLFDDSLFSVREKVNKMTNMEMHYGSDESSAMSEECVQSDQKAHFANSLKTDTAHSLLVNSVSCEDQLHMYSKTSSDMQKLDSLRSDVPDQAHCFFMASESSMNSDKSPKWISIRRTSSLNRPPGSCSPPIISRTDSLNAFGAETEIREYQIMSCIGQGAYGSVKLVYDTNRQQYFAMKIVDKKKLLKKFAMFRHPPARKSQTRKIHDPLSRIYCEIAILKKINHPNIVKLVEVLEDTTNDYLFMVFEYVKNGPILKIPTNSPLSEHVAWKYFRDVLLGIEYLHCQKIVHRDLKPSNMLLSDTGYVKITDFGVSREFTGLDAFLTGTAGTPAFMAPESLTEDEDHFYSGRAQDIWSLGVTLFSLVYGDVPFKAPYSIILYKKIRTEPLCFPEKPEVNESLKDLLIKILQKEPEKRYTLSQIKEHPWVTANSTKPLHEPEQHNEMVKISEKDVKNSVEVIPGLDTIALIKLMGFHRSFCNPLRKKRSGANSRPSRSADRLGSSPREKRTTNNVLSEEFLRMNIQ
ncbi:Calcium/calmodulin-dependent protein kinase kinase 1 [Trichinella pseudospiralis]|uniref:Calcium/calmodulin-dependent protein kinase kinase 1 n=2 Tax=Trichinella pseudospiralis TaxID=6337 RepID=A0A0V1EYA7_TRIPS|nr:Calcium/calmodulin-dependent protein kinase kinase 1 [Trichinella pseudospiralis]KRZ32053.1 Calcium/calmodulin-dependent protein kinase kinase 1 [Trichinella pseudospiralis]KRZ46339.1 Calcium/calmodulin-dependent protein kinase kinase 1 [Trichinella pseudospiralis]